MTKNKSTIFAVVGLAIMTLLSLTQLIPGLKLARYSVLVGVAFFLLDEYFVSKIPADQSLTNFSHALADLKKPGVLVWFFLPVLTAIVPNFIGDYLLHMDFSAHVLSRAGAMLSFRDLPILVLQVIVYALGEEIAWRGFFLGKTMKKFPFWLCAVGSSVLFAMGHLSTGNIALLLYDVFFVFIDSVIFSMVFKKSGNCVVSTLSHILGNVVGIIVCLLFV